MTDDTLEDRLDKISQRLDDAEKKTDFLLDQVGHEHHWDDLHSAFLSHPTVTLGLDKAYCECGARISFESLGRLRVKELRKERERVEKGSPEKEEE